ncbi:MAG TPA: hypothetical protein VK179_19630 [Bacteroidales bacterium]|nr:hypothetical protein [Bacteroidales bacterium]
MNKARLPLILQLLVFPAIFLLLQILLKIDSKWFYLSFHDPTYAFLFNGLNIANGSLKLGLSGFPGTPLQCLIALNLEVYKFFSGTSDLTLSVLSDPERFLNWVSLEILIMNTIALIFAGYYTYRRTGNFSLALALQLTPFISVMDFSMNTVVMLEPFLLCTELFILSIAASYVFDEKFRFTTKVIIVSSFLVAFGITTKTVFLPAFFILFFAIDSFRRKMVYALFTAIFTAILLIPVYPSFSSFISWYKLILTHTGIYGSGNAGLFDPHIYIQNIQKIVTVNALYTIALFFLIIAAVAFIIKSFRFSAGERKRRIITGLALSFVLNIAMVARHYSIHYLVTSFNLTIFSIILAVSFIPGIRYREKSSWMPSIIYISGCILIIFLIHRIGYSPGFQNPRLASVKLVQSHIKNAQRIIVLEKSGPFPETAMYHGLAYSAGMMPVYAPLLKEKYPATYFYNIGEKRLHDWLHDYNLIHVLSEDTVTYVYSALKSNTIPEALMKEISALSGKGFVRLSTIYTDTVFHDCIYKISADTQLLKSIISHSPVIANNDTILLNRDNPYGPGTKIKAGKGYYVISALRNSSDHYGSIVGDDENGLPYYRSNGLPSLKKDGKELIVLTLDVPEDLVNQTLIVYLWYPAKNKCTFEDFRIDYFKVDY